MITGELKSKVDAVWMTLYTGGISNPLSVIEQLTYLLFAKRLDELHTLRERKAVRTEKPIEEPIFNKRQDHLRWSRFKDTAPEKMFATVTQLQQHEFTKDGVPLWGIKHVNSGFSFPTDEFVTSEKAKKLASYSLIAGDLVMTRKGTIGNCHIYPTAFDDGITHSDLLRLRVSPDRANSQFICSQFGYSRKIQRQLEMMSPGAVMPGINVGKLKNLMVEAPPLDLQRRFATIVE